MVVGLAGWIFLKDMDSITKDGCDFWMTIRPHCASVFSCVNWGQGVVDDFCGPL